jgi:hypothetical protein
MIRRFATVLTIALLAGCASTGAKLEPGATRAEVEKTMGKPTETLVRATANALLLPARRGRSSCTSGRTASCAVRFSRP